MPTDGPATIAFRQHGIARVRGVEIDVSIIIATRDRWSLLATSLHAALAQTGVTFEVIVVDDGSATEPPPAVAHLLADDRVALVRAAEARGAAAAANLGVRTARAHWIAMLHDHDLWAPNHLATTLEACGHDGIDYAYSAAWLVDADRRITGFWPAPAPATLSRVLLEGNVIASSSVVSRRELWERAGGYDEWLTSLAAWDLAIRWSRIARACRVSAATVAAYAGPPSADQARELSELGRRYGSDAKREGVRFGRHVHAATAEGGAAPVDARPPWLVYESPTEAR